MIVEPTIAARQPEVAGTIIWHIATAMIEVEKSQARYSWGTPEARFYRDVAVPKPTAKVRFLEGMLMIVLFGMHSMYRKRLQSCRVKGMVYVPDFQRLMQSLVVEWAGECRNRLLHNATVAYLDRWADSNLLVGLSPAPPSQGLTIPKPT